ncbi:MAG: type VII toxin-antitoxin system HepT family RNase toxin, partial [Methanoculleaceae archaeon]
MLLSIQSAIDIATDVIAEERLRKPFTYRETFEVLAEEGIIPGSLARDLSNLAGFRKVLVHIYWGMDLKQVYAILQHDLAVLRAFS